MPGGLPHRRMVHNGIRFSARTFNKTISVKAAGTTMSLTLDKKTINVGGVTRVTATETGLGGARFFVGTGGAARTCPTVNWFPSTPPSKVSLSVSTAAQGASASSAATVGSAPASDAVGALELLYQAPVRPATARASSTEASPGRLRSAGRPVSAGFQFCYSHHDTWNLVSIVEGAAVSTGVETGELANDVLQRPIAGSSVELETLVFQLRLRVSLTIAASACVNFGAGSAPGNLDTCVTVTDLEADPRKGLRRTLVQTAECCSSAPSLALATSGSAYFGSFAVEETTQGSLESATSSAQESSCKPGIATGYNSSGTVIFEPDSALDEEIIENFKAGMSQWRTTDSQPKGDKPPTCRDYSLPELTLETTFCLWNCDREFWKVREFSRSDCGWADALTSRIYLNPDLSCDFEHTSAHEIGHVLNLRNVYDMECKEKTVMYGYSTGNPPVQIVDCEAAEEANPQVGSASDGAGARPAEHPAGRGATPRASPAPQDDCDEVAASPSCRSTVLCWEVSGYVGGVGWLRRNECTYTRTF